MQENRGKICTVLCLSDEHGMAQNNSIQKVECAEKFLQTIDMIININPQIPRKFLFFLLPISKCILFLSSKPNHTKTLEINTVQ